MKLAVRLCSFKFVLSALAIFLSCSSFANDGVRFVRPVLSGKNQSELIQFIKTRFAKDPSSEWVKMSYEKILNMKLKNEKFYIFESIPESQVSIEVPETLRIALRHKAVQEVLQLRMVARKITAENNQGKLDTFDDLDSPFYISVSNNSLFSLGPVFVDSTNFLILENNQVKKTNNLLTIEHINFFGRKILDLPTLAASGHLPYAIAHEMAHSIMQEVYGMKGMENLLGSHKATNGHDVMLTSDRTIALVEGWAEAFEAYLYEKYYPGKLPLPEELFGHSVTKYVFKNMASGSSVADRAAYIFRFLLGESDMSDFIAQHLAINRTKPIIQNQFLIEEPIGLDLFYAGFVQGMSIYKMMDASSVANLQRALAREGMVAHQFYTLLKSGNFANAVSVMAKHKPQTFLEFYQNYLQDNPKNSDELAWTFYQSFSRNGRIAYDLIHHEVRKRENAELRLRGREIAIIETFKPANYAQFRQLLIQYFPDISEYDYSFEFKDYQGVYKDLLKQLTTCTDSQCRFIKVLSEIRKANARSPMGAIALIKAKAVERRSLVLKRQTKILAHLREQFENDRDNSFQALNSELQQVPSELWLTSDKVGGFSRRVLGSGKARVDINAANRLELAMFMRTLYEDTMTLHEELNPNLFQPLIGIIFGKPLDRTYSLLKDPQVSDMSGAQETASLKAFGLKFIGDRSATMFDLADKVLSARPMTGYKSVLSLENELSVEWYQTIVDAYLRK